MIKERIIQVIENKRIAKESFYTKIGMTSASFRGKAKNTPLNSDAIKNILHEIPELDANWLITGKGEMFKQQITAKIESDFNKEKNNTHLTIYPTTNIKNFIHNLVTKHNKLKKYVIPLHEISPIIELDILFSKHSTKKAVDYIVIPNGPYCDGALSVRGDDMIPTLKAGDIICYKTIDDIDNIIYGEMYLLYINNGSDQYLTIRFIKKVTAENGYITLASENPKNCEKDIPVHHVKALAIIKMLIRYNTL